MTVPSSHGLLPYVRLVLWVSYRDLSLDVGPIWVIRSPSLKTLTVIITSKTFFPNKVTCRGSRDKDLGHRVTVTTVTLGTSFNLSGLPSSTTSNKGLNAYQVSGASPKVTRTDSRQPDKTSASSPSFCRGANSGRRLSDLPTVAQFGSGWGQDLNPGRLTLQPTLPFS